jgi:excisionase family DNA binding protein
VTPETTRPRGPSGALAQAIGDDPSTNTVAPGPDGSQVVSPYLTVEEVAARLRCSTRTVRDLARLRQIPHRRLPGGRRLLFLVHELEPWEAGAELETVELPRGGRLVKPVR